jgi:hypothetical protein
MQAQRVKLRPRCSCARDHLASVPGEPHVIDELGGIGRSIANREG